MTQDNGNDKAQNGGEEEQKPVRRDSFWDLGWPENMQEFMRGMFEPWGRNPWWRHPRFRYATRPFGFEWLPAIDVFEREDSLVVRADVPGAKPEDIEVSLQEDTLTIRGSRKEETEVNEESYHRAERSFGEFVRTVRVPTGTKAEEIKASFKDGVLEVVLPKPTQAKRVNVPIDTA